MDNPRIIVFEGVDNTGKTTLINILQKETDWYHYIIDRGTISNKAYSKKFNRKNNMNNTEKYLVKYGKTLVILLEAEKVDLIRRQNIKNDGYNTDDVDIDLKLFLEAFNKSTYNHKLKFNTSKINKKDIINEILYYLNNTNG